MILTIEQNPSVLDKILFSFNTRDANNNTIDPYKVDNIKIYFIERDFASTGNKEYSSDFYNNRDFVKLETHDNDSSAIDGLKTNFITKYSPIVQGTLTGTVFKNNSVINAFKVDAKNNFIITDTAEQQSQEYKITCGSVDLETGSVVLEWNQNPGSFAVQLNYEYKKSSGNDFFYYKEAKPVKIVGSEDYPAWLSTDLSNSLIEKSDCSIGSFSYTWDATGSREGDYFICYTWTPYPGIQSLSSHEKFYLSASTEINTSIPSHQTNPNKYEILLDRYLPEMFKTTISEQDKTPGVLGQFNKSIAQGFTFLEDMANQIIDLFDANSINESMINYLSNTLDLKLKSSDPTLWRRQIKEAIPLFKKKGSIQAIKESFSQAGMKLLRLTNFWQIKSSCFQVDSFFYESKLNNSFILSRKPIVDNSEYAPRVFLTKMGSTEPIELNFINTIEKDADRPTKINWISSYSLENGDIVRFEYYYRIPNNEKEKLIEDYIKSLPLLDERDEKAVIKDAQVFQEYPLKNWNARLIREDDPLLDSIITEKHPFHENLVFGKVRTEFPYSENVYNMEEYNGSIVDSSNPCDIDKDFIDPCSHCRSGKFDIDLEIEGLSSDRILEAKEIISESFPFHAVLKTINIFGSNTEFVTPPIEDLEILLQYKYQESAISGGLNVFQRNKYLENLKNRNELSDKNSSGSYSAKFYNKEIVLLCPNFNFNSLSISENCYVNIFSPSTNSGRYPVIKKNKNQLTISGIAEPLNSSPFYFRVYNELLQSNISLTRNDWVELEDRSVDFEKIAADAQQIKININNQYYLFDIIKFINNHKILIKNNDLVINQDISVNYKIINRNNEEIILKNNTKNSSCLIKYTNNSAVEFSGDFPSKAVLKNYKNILEFAVNNIQYSCEVTGFDENYVYIKDYNGGNFGSMPAKFQQILIDKEWGGLYYNGVLAKINGNLKNILGIEDEPKSSTDSIKEDYAIRINTKNDYYFISDINYDENLDITVLNLSGFFDNFGTEETDGLDLQTTIYKYTKKAVYLTDDDTSKQVFFHGVNRTSNEQITNKQKSKSSEIESVSALSKQKDGVTDCFEQNENIQILITNLDGTKERKEL